MPDIQLNVTQAEPSIPNAENAPQKIKPLPGTPLSTDPIIISTSRAKDATRKNLDTLSELTGKIYTF